MATVAGAHALLLATVAHLGTFPTAKSPPIEVALLRADRPEPMPPEPPEPLPAAVPQPDVPATSVSAPTPAPRTELPPKPPSPPSSDQRPPRTELPPKPPPAPRAQPAPATRPANDNAPAPSKGSPPPAATTPHVALAPALDPSPNTPAPPTPPREFSANTTPPANIDTNAATVPSITTPAQPVAMGPRADASWAGNTPPPYPPAARRLREEGDVRLSVHIDESGRVTEVKIARSSGSSRLDAAAVETVKKWRFKPATVDGQAVASWYDDWIWSFRVDP